MVIHELSDEECLRVIAAMRFGRLGCAHDQQPYVVPIYYAYHKGAGGLSYLYSFTTVGQKVEWMRVNPLVCVEWDEVERFDRWTSVIAYGRYEELTAQPGAGLDEEGLEQEMTRAYELLREHSATWWQPGSAAFVLRTDRKPNRVWTPVYYRIHLERVTGRRAAPDA